MRRPVVFIVCMALVLFIAQGFTLRPLCSQPPKLSTRDSLLIASYIRYTKMHFFDNAEFRVDTSSERTVYRVLKKYNVTVGGGQVHYAPDGFVEIVSINISVCGANCSDGIKSYVLLNSGKAILGGDVFSSIREICELGNDKYLVLHESQERGLGCFDRNLKATVFSVKKDSVVLYPFSYKRAYREEPDDDRKGEERKKYYDQLNAAHELASLSFTSGIGNDSVYMVYDPKMRRLRYQYANQCGGANASADLYKGYFDYKNGGFIQGDEVIIKEPEPAENDK